MVKVLVLSWMIFNNKQLFIPKGFAHGFVVMSEIARVSYKVDNYYNPESERGINFNDSITWTLTGKLDISSIILNEKDTKYPELNSNSFF